MKAIFVVFFINSLANAAQIPYQEALQKLKPLAMQSKTPTVFASEKEISVTLPTEKPRGDEKQEWIFSYIKAFAKNGKTVSQIAIETENCKVREAELDKTAMQIRMANLIKTVSNQVFGKAFELNEDRYFKELGPYWRKSVHVKVHEIHPGVRSMHLSRNISKCDSRGGFAFRFDFIL